MWGEPGGPYAPCMPSPLIRPRGPLLFVFLYASLGALSVAEVGDRLGPAAHGMSMSHRGHGRVGKVALLNYEIYIYIYMRACVISPRVTKPPILYNECSLVRFVGLNCDEEDG